MQDAMSLVGKTIVVTGAARVFDAGGRGKT
jgi:hypothetical protein